MKILKGGLALTFIISLLMSIVPFGSQMEKENTSIVAAMQAKAKSKDYKYKSSTLKVKRGKNTIYGKIFLLKTKKKKKFPTLIYSHGFGGNYEYGGGLCKRFLNCLTKLSK